MKGRKQDNDLQAKLEIFYDSMRLIICQILNRFF